DRELGEGGSTFQRVQPDYWPLYDPRPEGVHDRAAGWPRLAPIPPSDAALDRRHLYSRHARAARCLLFGPRHGPHRIGAIRTGPGALFRLRAPGALDDGDLLHHPRAFRPQYHIR